MNVDLLVLNVLSNEQEMHVTEVMQNIEADTPWYHAAGVQAYATQQELLRYWLEVPALSGTTDQFNVATGHPDKHRGTSELLHPRVRLCWSLHLSSKEEPSQKQMNEMEGEPEWEEEADSSATRVLLNVMANWRNQLDL